MHTATADCRRRLDGRPEKKTKGESRDTPSEPLFLSSLQFSYCTILYRRVWWRIVWMVAMCWGKKSSTFKISRALDTPLITVITKVSDATLCNDLFRKPPPVYLRSISSFPSSAFPKTLSPLFCFFGVVTFAHVSLGHPRQGRVQTIICWSLCDPFIWLKFPLYFFRCNGVYHVSTKKEKTTPSNSYYIQI